LCNLSVTDPAAAGYNVGDDMLFTISLRKSTEWDYC